MAKRRLKNTMHFISLTVLGVSLLYSQNVYAKKNYEIGSYSTNYKPVLVKEVPLLYDFYGHKLSSNIEELDLKNMPIDDNFSNELKKFKYLNTVDLRSHSLSTEELTYLKEMYPFINFKYDIKLNNKIYDSDIEDLDLSHIKIDDLSHFKKSLSLFKNLKTLDMSECNLTNEQLGELREEFPDVQIDWVLHLSKWKFRTDVTSFSVLVYKFDYARITSKQLEVFKYCRNLEALDLGHQAITDVSLIAKYLPNLKILILSDNKISDITPLSSLTKLHYLELFINPIRDISPLKNLKELVDINLCYTKVRDYSPLYELPYLERIWLVGAGANYKTMSGLKQKFPKAQIVNSGGGSTNAGFRTHERYYEMIKMFKDRYYMSPSFSKYNGISNNNINYLNKEVEIIVDFKLGSKYNSMIYLTNYGHLKDNKDIKVHIIGEYNELNTYKGMVIAILRKENEDVLVVSHASYSDDAIKALVEYKEKNSKYEIIH